MSTGHDRVKAYVDQNRRAWNEIAELRHRTRPPASFFAEGGSVLDGRLVEGLGDVMGRRILHLQCATGEETLCLRNLGAEITGVDLSEAQIELAKAKARAAGIEARFVAADVYALPDDLQDGRFDDVVTGAGSMLFLPELAGWSAAVARAVRAGGRLVLFEEHPLAEILESSGENLHITHDYFGRDQPYQSRGWEHFEGAADSIEAKFFFIWPVSDIITALIQAGFSLERFEEYPCDSKWGRFSSIGPRVRSLPGTFLLLARRHG